MTMPLPEPAMTTTDANFTGEPTSEPFRPLTNTTDVGRQRAREKRRKTARAVRQFLLLALLLAAGIAAFMALRPQPVPVDVAQAVLGSLVVAIEETGVTRVKDRYVVSAPVAGSLSRLPLEAGDPVHEGDTLVEIAPSLSPLLDERALASAQARVGATLSALGQARAQAARAVAAKELAENELGRERPLFEHGSLTRQALDESEFEVRMRNEELSSAVFAVKVAGEEVRLARASLGRDNRTLSRDQHVDVIAPVSGQVLRVYQKSAGVVQAGTPISEIGDPTALEVVVDLLTTDAVHVQPGTAVTIQGWGGDEQLAGRVRRIEPSAFTRPSALGIDEQRVNVIVMLIDPHERWASLADGYRVEARFVLWSSEKVLKVPQGALFRHGDGWAVYRVDHGVSRLVPVSIGHRGETEVELTQGLSAGSWVAVHPGDRVKDGARVRAR
jgi:HlyD family secretion protein